MDLLFKMLFLILHSMELQSIKQRFDIIGDDPQLNRAIDIAVQVAWTDLSVLITGESGVGKEAIPQIIHQYSSRKHGMYVAINCGAIPEGTIDSELFGHEKGSFTGASEMRKGYFEVAKDASRRFTVRVPGRGDVNVYGTTFNIDAYRGNDCVTTLVEGSIGYSYTNLQGHDREYRLEPSQRLVHHQHNGKVEITEADCTIATAWKDNKIILQQTPLKDILGMLERKYDVDFRVDNKKLYGNTFSGGAISMNGLEYVLETLEISSGIHWQYVGFQGYDTTPRMTVRIY